MMIAVFRLLVALVRGLAQANEREIYWLKLHALGTVAEILRWLRVGGRALTIKIKYYII